MHTHAHKSLNNANDLFAGIHNWTLGQRIHLGGLDAAYFVAKIVPETKQILVVRTS